MRKIETTPKETITYKYDKNGNLIEKGNTKYYWTYFCNKIIIGGE
jgi:hypothetical protein